MYAALAGATPGSAVIGATDSTRHLVPPSPLYCSMLSVTSVTDATTVADRRTIRTTHHLGGTPGNNSKKQGIVRFRC